MGLSTFDTKGARAMSKQNYTYFKLFLDELLEKYEGKYVAIKDKAVIGAYDSFDEAYETTVLTEEQGTFIVQHCVRDQEVHYFVSGNVDFTEDEHDETVHSNVCRHCQAVTD